MKPPNRFVKILVLSVFLLLITGFVAYRSGIFTDEVTPAAEAAPAKNSPDTNPPYRPDLPPPEKTILPSSKSLSPAIPVLSPDMSDYFILDTTQKLEDTEPPGADQPGRPDTRQRIGSGNDVIKSTYVYDMVLHDANYRLPDSLIKKLQRSFLSSTDSSKIIPYRNNTITTMPGSKSGYLFQPRIKPGTSRKQKP